MEQAMLLLDAGSIVEQTSTTADPAEPLKFPAPSK